MIRISITTFTTPLVVLNDNNLFILIFFKIHSSFAYTGLLTIVNKSSLNFNTSTFEIQKSESSNFWRFRSYWVDFLIKKHKNDIFHNSADFFINFNKWVVKDLNKMSFFSKSPEKNLRNPPSYTFTSSTLFDDWWVQIQS